MGSRLVDVAILDPGLGAFVPCKNGRKAMGMIWLDVLIVEALGAKWTSKQGGKREVDAGVRRFFPPSSHTGLLIRFDVSEYLLDAAKRVELSNDEPLFIELRQCAFINGRQWD